jgi:phosphate transport system permease protein
LIKPFDCCSLSARYSSLAVYASQDGMEHTVSRQPLQQSSMHPFAAKQTRRGEWLIEHLIRGIASVAILLIFFILLFVLREALPLFFSRGNVATPPSNVPIGKQQSVPTKQLPSQEELVPEVYNPDVTLAAKPELLVPEVYNPDVVQPQLPQRSSENSSLSELDERSNEEITLDNVLGTVWQPVSIRPKFGIIPLLIGTFKTTFVAILIGAPLGILAAIYAAFLAHKRFREVIKPMIEILAGFPSVVIGFFCLIVVGSTVQSLFGLEYRLNAFVGGIGLAIAVIPIVFTITEDALSAVPKSLWEAALAMGATKWEAAYRVMLPAAFPGVFAAVLLGTGRAFGETMIALMATGNAALVSASLTDPARTLSATIGAEMGEVIWGSAHYQILFFLGILLFIVSFTLNAITELFVKERLARKLRGG